MNSIVTVSGDKLVSYPKDGAVSLSAFDGQGRAYLDLTPDEAEQIAAGLMQAAAEAKGAKADVND